MTTSDFKKGMPIKYNGDTWLVTDYQFVNPGKGAAFTRTKLKNVKSGKVVETTFKSGETIEEANMEYKNCTYMYKDATDFYFMDTKTYDQFPASATMIGDRSDFLQENSEVKMVMVDNQPVDLQLPTKMVFKVISTPPGEKGDTATGGTKPAVIDTGATVNVPLFIKEGDNIRVNTETHNYVERANE